MTKGIFILPHTKRRMNERGITPKMVELALNFGRRIHAPGTLFYFVGKRDMKKITCFSRDVDRLEGTTLVLDPGENVVITCFKNKNFLKSIRQKVQ